ncbi:MAG: endonuclease/exonuclease/phosphatase family protein [Anaerolineae bacterium]|nr:endonuclease/exonuclease/phosphatase family protein [Promineifilum sp.]MCZ2114244.1 endonuclease/exonuclease/phosphatase family protein [Anaerolineae bacterium]
MYGFTAVTLNLRGRANRWPARRHLLVGQLVDALPDIVALQEISLPISQGAWLARQVNIRLTGDSRRPYRIIQARYTHPRHFFEAVGIMTRMPVIYHEAVPLGYGGQMALRVNIELPAGAAGSRRQSLDFVSVRLHHGGSGGQTRHEQVMNLVGRLNEKRRVPLQVVAGDFNEPSTGYAIALMRQSYRSAYAEAHGRDPLATYPTNLLQPQPVSAACLDYVFISPAVHRVTAASIFADKAAVDDDKLYPSDHVGLIVNLEV